MTSQPGLRQVKKSTLAIRTTRTAWLFLLPSLLCFLVFTAYPVFASLYISFFKWDGLTEMSYVGLANYQRLLTDSNFIISLKNNLYYTFVSVPLTMLFAFLLAMAMNVKLKGIAIYRIVYYLPNITASVAIGIIWAMILLPNGPLNNALRSLGIQNPPRWLNSSQWAMPSVIMVSVWRNVGYYAIIMLAGLQGISQDLYEAADIDGASRLRKTFSITIPMLSPTLFFCTIMSIIGSFQVFDTIMSMTQGGPGRATKVLVLYIYQTCFETPFRFGYASAMAYVLFFIILIITLIQFRGQQKWVNY